eukprot:jgi/Mesen1/6011/ME000306S05274
MSVSRVCLGQVAQAGAPDAASSPQLGAHAAQPRTPVQGTPGAGALPSDAPGTGRAGEQSPAGTQAGQKKPADGAAPGQPPSKKAKPGEGESIDQLNDVTAVSGVDLREEEENLLALPTGGGASSDAQRKLAREAEERLFLEKNPLRSRIAAIANKCGVRGVHENTLRCLSVRLDMGKARHKTVTTGNVVQQLRLMEKRDKAEAERREAEANELLRKLGEKARRDKESNLGEVEKEAKAKAQQMKEKEDEKARAKSANEAAKAAIGADPRLAKWMRMGHEMSKGAGGAKKSGVSQYRPTRLLLSGPPSSP